MSYTLVTGKTYPCKKEVSWMVGHDLDNPKDTTGIDLIVGMSKNKKKVGRVSTYLSSVGCG